MHMLQQEVRVCASLLQPLSFAHPILLNMFQRPLLRLQPLPTGRLLTIDDISPALVGRQAELFWPDDGKWYLIQFNAVYMDQRKAE
jgi:hypothetical protein